MRTKKRKSGGRRPMLVPPRQFVSKEKRHFFRIFVPEAYRDRLPLPRAFLEHIEHEPSTLASLIGPSENVWPVMLDKDANGISVQNGWQEFLEDNNICKHDFLLFRYDAGLRFTVRVFDKSGCEREAASLHSAPGQLLTISKAERRKVTMVRNYRNFQISDDAGCISGSKKKHRRVERHHLYVYNGHNNRISGASTQPSTKAPDIDYMHEGKYDLNGGMSDGLVYCDLASKEPLGHPETSVVKFVRHEKIPAKKRSYAPVGDKTASGIWRGVLVSPPAGLLVSQQRPVTEHEMCAALNAARSFTSKHPFTLVVMRKSYVSYGYCLHLPRPFIRDHVQLHPRELKLWDPSGTGWIVNFICSIGRGRLSSGWGAFSRANKLEQGDVCVFELTRRSEMRVHIFRVIEEVIPLTG